jgi:glutamate--cysteine ligase
MLQNVAKIIRLNSEELNSWYKLKLSKGHSCFYSSVDLRYSGDKLVPVDTNLFPAGFNNLNKENINQAKIFVKDYIESNFSKVKKILLVGESNTRNVHYLDNLKTLEKVINEAGYDCILGSLDAEENIVYEGIIYQEIKIHSLIKDMNKLISLDGFIPDIIILNNDLINGVHEKLESIEQAIIPDINNGWFRRRKSRHFEIYNQLLKELEEKFCLPSFLLSTEFSICEDLNFKDQQGLDGLAKKVDEMLSIVKDEYLKHNIPDEPFVVIKSDYGSYGMGIMMVKSAHEIHSLNKKLRKQMHVTKNNMVNEQVIIQEGVKTIDVVNGEVAEPLLYLVNHNVISFLYRTHNEKDEYSNLNSIGMSIVNHELDLDDYRLCCEFVAKIASLAAALELVSS